MRGNKLNEKFTSPQSGKYKYTIFPLKMYKPGRKLQVSAKKSQTKLAKIHFTELKSEKIPKLLKNRKWNPSKFIVTRFFLMLTPKN